MTIYVLAAVNKNDTETDLRNYDRYVNDAAESIMKYDVGVLASDEQPEVVEGKLPGRKIVLLKFRDKAHMETWYNSDEYQKVAPLRWGASDTPFIISFQGLE